MFKIIDIRGGGALITFHPQKNGGGQKYNI
jgi:hypothetical protein